MPIFPVQEKVMERLEPALRRYQERLKRPSFWAKKNMGEKPASVGIANDSVYIYWLVVEKPWILFSISILPID